jgi:nucleoside 2-deoxyribosyltransferase
MGQDQDATASTAPIKEAVEALLKEPEFDELLNRAGVAPRDRSVHIPEGIHEQEIIHSIFSRLDVADLVIFNMTPKPDEKQASPNVFYELGLVHALGIPAIIVKAERGEIPFYAAGMKQQRVADFQLATLCNALRSPLREFLDTENTHTNFVNDRVTQFYGMPIVDISAAVGLATGYYQNFVSRLIMEDGFLASYSELIRHVILARPSGVDSTYDSDKALLKAALTAAGHTLTEKFQLAGNQSLGPIWFDHVQGVVIDLPRTIYPLQRSPRLFAFLDRHREVRGAAERAFNQRYRQLGERLLDRVEQAIRYQMRQDAQRVRSRILHFSTIADTPGLVSRLLNGAS